MEVDEDVEDDDVDFNPFLRDVTPSETSSSLTSDTECEGTSSDKQLSSGLYLPNGLRVSDGNVSTQNRLSSGGGCYEETAPENISPLVCYENGGDGLNELNNEELPSQAARPLMEQNPCRLMLEVSEEDAICRRTRARYSLANYSLEELETFLQESDDDGDLQNVDEEEEYHKFLAAVLLGAGDGTHACQGDENQDEDENDADFELEIEEALESDGDDNAENYEDMDCRKEKDGHRPQTRQKRRLTELIGAGNYSHELTKSPLRPILPYISPVLLDPGHSYGWPHTTLFLSSSLLSGAGAALLNGFTDQQMGQLHVLIHEHVQLLIQTFSLCVLDPSKQHVAADVKKMIFEIVGCRDQALARRNIPHQQSCFESQYLCSSFNSSSSKSSEFLWAPLIKSPVLSILDVAPLQLATGYLNDVTAAVVKYRRSHVDGTADRSHSRKEPLFPLSEDDTSKANNGSQGRSGSVSASSAVSSGQLQHKKSLAATLVESTKKESVALVPSDIARLAQRFYELFNISLFPHKPPPAAVANRVLFTDAEDGLLALGLLEYNNDWEAIQKRFLPCKSKHQIFVRQKNRSSSKAPDNPIKDVRRMKTSPLTIEEKERIQEGLKVFKNDWTSVWRFFVPHRDPSLLQRQWRVATGAQKSYSKSEAAKEKRRLYEAKRRKLKASLPDSLVRELEGDNEVADCADGVENDDDSYVNEAFLADTEDKSSNMLPYQLTFSSPARKIMQPDRTMMQSGTNLGEECGSAADDCREPQKANGTKFDVIAPSKPLEATNSMSNRSNMSSCTSYATSSKNSFSTKLRSSGGPLVQMQSSKLCKDKGSRVVRLAPDLPPVNLPPTVRVISQLEFHKNAPHYDGTSNNAAKVLFPVLPPDFTESSCRSNSLRQLNLFPDHSASVSLQRNGASNGNTTEDATESDFQMHPLLFQYPREGFSSYSHPVRDFIDHSRRNDLFPFEKLQIEKNVNLRKASIEKETPVNANTIDFHPLLQRTEDRNYGEMPEGDCHQFIDQPELRESLVEGQSTARQPSTSTCERESNLDLDIHLCSSMDFPNAKKDCVGMLSKSNIQAEECRRCSTVITEPETGNACSRHCTEEPNEESMQGIVMEQEELSDSEEDSQHVEFECEEMDDSDEEQIQGSGSSPTQNKDISTSVAPGELQGSHDQSQIQQVSAKVGKQGGSAMLKLQSSSHARSARAKSKPENAKRSKSRTSQSASPCRPTQSSRAKMRNSKVQQGHKVAVHKLTVSRRPRKTPAPS